MHRGEKTTGSGLLIIQLEHVGVRGPPGSLEGEAPFLQSGQREFGGEAQDLLEAGSMLEKVGFSGCQLESDRETVGPETGVSGITEDPQSPTPLPEDCSGAPVRQESGDPVSFRGPRIRRIVGPNLRKQAYGALGLLGCGDTQEQQSLARAPAGWGRAVGVRLGGGHGTE